jgi:hypothetical protein
MKLLDIILEDENTSLDEGYNVVTKEGFLNNMKELFPYKGGCLYDFPNLEDFRKIATVNAHCKKHKIDFPVKVDNLRKGDIGSQGCTGCKKDKIIKKTLKNQNNFYDQSNKIWTGETGNPLYIYNRPGLRKFTGGNNEFDFYCPKIGTNGKPHGKQTIKNAQKHIYQDNRYPNYPYEGCEKCREEQGIVRKLPTELLSRIDFIKKVQEKMKSYDIPIDWYDWEGMGYVNPSRNAKIKCLKHNEEVTRVKAFSFYTGTPLCPECNRLVKGKNFMEKIHELYNDRFVLLSDYIGGTSPVTLGCTLHGKTPYPVVVNASSIWSSTENYGSIECKECKRVKQLNKFKNTTYNLNKERFKDENEKPYSYPNLDSEFKRMTDDIHIECHKIGSNGREHGMFLQTPANHSAGQGCPICQESKNQIHIKNLLFENDYKEFETEKQFKELGNQKFDFYIPEPGYVNILIEYDGEQHFEPRFAKSEYTRQLNYNILYESDNLKNQFIETNNLGLGLIRIPYTLKKGTYDKLLLDALKSVEAREIRRLGDYPERQLPKEPVHKDKVDLSQRIQKPNRTGPKLSLVNTLKNI